MKAVVFHSPGNVAVEEVADPRIEAPSDAIIKMCNRQLRDLIIRGQARPSQIISHELPLDAAPDAYEKFDKRADGYTKVVLHPGQAT